MISLNTLGSVIRTRKAENKHYVSKSAVNKTLEAIMSSTPTYQNKLNNMLSLSRSTIDNAIKLLEERGDITITRSGNKNIITPKDKL